MSDGPATLTVDLGERSYDILVGDGLLAGAGKLIAPVLAEPRAVVITDENVEKHCLGTLEKSLDEAGID
ncbi:MAG: 3-dehydroquinate synthase, partial [Proteobacteria bacterium]|nr:3-dehydroquinate synthase [Pseudomonadota bacterium]